MMMKIKAFTLIETIFAIVIFCVGILVVLLWLSQTLRNQDYANTQIKSAFFAREWIELMFNLRDANYHKKLPWNCVFEWGKKLIGDWCKNVFSPSDLNILKVSIWSWDEYISIKKWTLANDFEKDFEEFQIYLHTWVSNNWFSYDYDKNNGKETWFARYVVIDSVNGVDEDHLLKIESHVLFRRWGLTWEKVMETFIWNYEFKQ